jgi:hypothetical protein
MLSAIKEKKSKVLIWLIRVGSAVVTRTSLNCSILACVEWYL